MDCPKWAVLLAKRAAHAILWLKQFRKHMNVPVKRGKGNAKCFRAAPGDADAACAACIRVHDRFFPLRAGNAFTKRAVTIQNRALGTDSSTNAAGNTAVDVDRVPLFRDSFDGENRALLRAGGAAVAVFRDEIRHMPISFCVYLKKKI